MVVLAPAKIEKPWESSPSHPPRPCYNPIFQVRVVLFVAIEITREFIVCWPVWRFLLTLLRAFDLQAFCRSDPKDMTVRCGAAWQLNTAEDALEFTVFQ